MMMDLKLKSIYRMKKRILTLLITIPLLASCASNKTLESRIFSFDTFCEIKLYEGNEDNLKFVEEVINYFDKLSDNYKERDITNVYSINHTNEDIKVDKDLYDMLKAAYEVSSKANHFNIMCGSLVKAWKAALDQSEVLEDTIINAELYKIENGSLIFKENNVVQRIGDAEIDLGGYVKGYVLDKIKDYLNEKQLSSYLINAGYSSILLGKKNTKDEKFRVGINGQDGFSLLVKDKFVSTSGSSEQSATIADKTYSHIVDPKTGSALATYDSVIVLADEGALADALSTSLFLAPMSEIEEAEDKYNIKAIVIQDGKIIHMDNDVEASFH